MSREALTKHHRARVGHLNLLFSDVFADCLMRVSNLIQLQAESPSLDALCERKGVPRGVNTLTCRQFLMAVLCIQYCCLLVFLVPTGSFFPKSCIEWRLLS